MPRENSRGRKEPREATCSVTTIRAAPLQVPFQHSIYCEPLDQVHRDTDLISLKKPACVPGFISILKKIFPGHSKGTPKCLQMSQTPWVIWLVSPSGHWVTPSRRLSSARRKAAPHTWAEPGGVSSSPSGPGRVPARSAWTPPFPPPPERHRTRTKGTTISLRTVPSSHEGNESVGRNLTVVGLGLPV